MQTSRYIYGNSPLIYLLVIEGTREDKKKTCQQQQCAGKLLCSTRIVNVNSYHAYWSHLLTNELEHQHAPHRAYHHDIPRWEVVRGLRVSCWSHVSNGCCCCCCYCCCFCCCCCLLLLPTLLVWGPNRLNGTTSGRPTGSCRLEVLLGSKRAGRG